MKNMIELSKEETILIEGGNLYEIGYSVGSFFANCYDFINGYYQGFKAGFDK